MNEALMKRFFQKNPDTLTDAELLELLLHYCSDDAKNLVLCLQQHYPQIASLMEAGVEDLSVIEELDRETILLLRLVPELHRRYFLSRAHIDTCLLDANDYGRYLLPYFYGARDELVYLLMLDAACKVINCRLIARGSVNSTNVPLRKLVQAAVNANASGLILAHNHPSGIAIPSNEDVEITMQLASALAVLDITVIDHLIIADDDFVSLKQSGYLPEL